MGLWDAIAHLFGRDDDESPGDEEREEAEAVDEFTREGGEGKEYFNEGVGMGTVPSTPPDYEGEDTDEHPTVKPWWQFW